ncbi:hypothetical protein ABRY23_04910 [Melioribacteraceae bacterium 4301-Me]|uniref:hypothetical protein n=1 Tax=Pyranulibacter aquaticus TaxID=3163344 RepID=UPI003599239A
MKKILLVLFLMPLIIYSQNINGILSSSYYTFQRFDNLNNSETFVRSYQTMSLNFNKDNLSLRTRLNFESNIGNTLISDPRLRFYNLYFEARNLFKVATLKIGRQSLFNSVAGGVYDGVNLQVKYSNFSLVGYYGGNVPAYQKLKFTDDLSNDYILGGKLETTLLQNFRFAISYVDKNFKPVDYETIRLSENLDPITILILQKSNQYKFLSAEASYELERKWNVNTRFDYDLNFSKASKFEINGRLQATDNFGIDLYYNYREPRIRYNSIFSVFNYGNTQEMEAGLDYKINKTYTLIGKFANVVYEDENSQRITVGVNSSFGSLTYRKNLGYAGELDAISIYAAKSFAEGTITPSLGLSYTSYKLSEDSPLNSITSVLAGVNLRPFTQFSFDVQGQYFNNKIYKNDFRLLLKINYWFNTNF